MLKDSVFTFISRVVMVALGAINSVMLARFLGPAGQGVFVVAATLITMLSAIGGLGIGNANIYFIGQKRYETRILFWNSVLGSIVVGGFLIGIAYAVYEIIPSVFQGVSKSLILLYAISLPLLLGWGHISSFLVGFQRFQASNIINICIGLLTSAAYLIFLSSIPTVQAVIIISIIMSGLSVVLSTAYIIWKIDPAVLKPAFSIKILSESIIFGIKGHLGSVIQLMNYRLDRLFVNWFIGPSGVGFYSVAVILAESLWYLSSSIAFVLFPKISASNDVVSSAQVTAKSCRISFLFAFALSIALILIGPWLIPLIFGEAFIQSVPALNFLIPGVVVFTLTNVITSYIIGRGFPFYNTLIALVSFAVMVPLDLLLIPIWGITGAAIAGSVSYILATATALYYYKKIALHDSLSVKQEITVSLTDILIIKNRDWQSIRNIFRYFGV
jgi:O-antigen/teichoic acid export membrane protein